MTPFRRFALPATLVAAALLITACGTTEETAAGTPAAAGEQITVTDSRGEEITLDGPAEEVVGLEWNVVEHLVSLGVMPVGVADVEGYGAWVAEAPLEGDVTDVGLRGEPSIDAIAALSPDLVLATTDLPQAAVDQLEELAPVIVVRSADAGDAIGQMRENVEIVATATGTQEEAEELLADFDTTLADSAAALADAGLADDEFMFADGYLDGGRVSIRPFGQGSLVGDVTEELGLVNAWTAEGDPDYGLGATDVEGLTALDDVHFLYITNGSAEEDPFAAGLAGHAVWESLPFVASGDVHRLPDGIWMFGGPVSMTAYVDAVVAELA